MDPLGGGIPSWLDGTGPEAGVVLGTRAQLVRNIAGFRFPRQATADERDTILREVTQWAGADDAAGHWRLAGLAGSTEEHRNLLVEKQLLDREDGADLQGRGLLVAPGASRSILVNVLDHLRLTAFRSGFDAAGTVADAAELESRLEREFGFAYQEALGYLTTWPGSTGTGLHLTALVHLPGLVLAEEIDKIINALQQLRFSVQGLYGQGNAVRGCLFRITSQVTLGRDEDEIVRDFTYHLGKVLAHETSARGQLYARDRLWLEDLVQRSLAVLRAARLITAQESFDRLSHLRLGLNQGMLPEFTPGSLNRLLLGMQTAHLAIAAGSPLAGNERAEARATFLRQALPEATGR